MAVVTGAGRGIGRAIAIALANAGVKIAALARTQSEVGETATLIEKSGGKVQAFVADVTDEEGTRATINRAQTALGPVDLLVNNAGQLGRIGPFVEADPVEWWRVLDTNLRGPMLTTSAVLPGMISRRRGRIINIASSAVPLPYLSAYVTSKTALLRFTETIAAETRTQGVYVFAVGPGTIRTAMSEHSLYSEEGQKWIPWFARVFEEKLDVPVERPAQLVVKLASGSADALSGQLLSVSDDLNLLQQRLDEVERNHFYSLRVRKLDEALPPPTLAAILRAAEQGDCGSP